MAELEPGDIFAGHRIDGVAGRGGMGVVYRATQLDLERPVALKLIATNLAEDPSFRERFVRESRLAASIDHPHVIPIYYAGEADGTLYLAMRYVDGEDLRALVRRDGMLAPQRAAAIVSQLGGALDSAHARGLVHRDVKPANVLLGTEDHAYLTDFGLTKRLLDTSALSRTGQWVGTFGYVAPEQIRGHRVDARTDVFALGCVLFFALTAATPFQRETDEATLWAHLHDPPEPVDVLAPDAPSEFAAVLARALAKDPDDRYQSAGDLGRAALAAARESVTPAPKGLVARGAAAPGDDADDETIAAARPASVVGGDDDGGDDATGVTTLTEAGSARRRRRRVLAGAALIGAVAVAVAVVLLAGGGSSTHAPTTSASLPHTTPKPDTTPATTTTPTGPGGAVARVLDTKMRVNTVAVLGPTVWVSSHQGHRLVSIRRASGTRGTPVVQAQSTAAIASGFHSLWILNQRHATVFRLPIGSRHVTTATTGLTAGHPGGLPILLTIGADSVWVGLRTPGESGLIRRIAPARGHSPIVATIAVPDGVLDMAVGYGALWVINRSVHRVVRIDLKSGTAKTVMRGGDLQHIAAGAGGVWVTDDATDTLIRISPYTYRTTTVGYAGRGPTALSVTDRAVWVVAQDDGTATQFDPSTEAAGQPFRVCANPFAVAPDGNGAWIVCLNGDVVQVTR